MARLIPKKMKSKGQVYRQATWADLLICVIAFLMIVFVVISVLPFKFGFALIVMAIAITLLVRVDCLPIYIYVLHFFRHFGMPHRFARDVSDSFLMDRKESRQKAFGELFNDEDELRKQELSRLLSDPDVSEEVKEKIRLHRAQEEERIAAIPEPEDKMKCKPMELLCPFTQIADDMIDYANEYYGAVVAVSALESPITNVMIEAVATILKDNPCTNIVKLERPFRASASDQTVMLERLNHLEAHYYLVLFNEDKQALKLCADAALERLAASGVEATRLTSKQIAVFLKYSNYLEFDEDQIERIPEQDYALWAMPKLVKIKANTVEVNRLVTHNLRAVGFPQLNDDGWLANLFNIPSTKCVLKCCQIDREYAINAVKSLACEPARKGEYQQLIDDLLTSLEKNEETLLQVSIYVTAYDRAATEERLKGTNEWSQNLPKISDFKEKIRNVFGEEGIILNRMPFDQLYAFLGAQVSAMDTEGMVPMPSMTLAASMPWTSTSRSIQTEPQADAEGERVVVLGELNVEALNDQPSADCDGMTSVLASADGEATLLSEENDADGMTMILSAPSGEIKTNEEHDAVTAGE